jgi:hypothetical protein
MEGWQEMKKSTVLITTLLLVTILYANPVMGETGKIKFGNLEILPAIGFDVTWDDNIFLRNGNPGLLNSVLSDTIYKVKPALFFDYTFDGRGKMSLGYDGTLAYYDEYNYNDWESHKVPFKFDYKSPGGLIAGLDYLYEDTNDPFSNEADALNATLLPVQRDINDLGTELGYQFGETLKALGYYNYRNQRYSEPLINFSQDYDNNEGGLGVEARFLPKTWGFLRYHYGDRDYVTQTATVNDSNNSDYKYHRVNAGVAWDGGAKWTGEFNLGYKWQDYKNDFDSQGNAFADIGTWIADTYIGYQMTKVWKLGFTLSRDLKQTGSASLQYNEDTSVGLNVDYTAFEKTTVTAGYTYRRNDYNTGRDDRIDQVDVGVKYKIQPWLVADATYLYKARDSTIIRNEYDDNQFMVGIKAGF